MTLHGLTALETGGCLALERVGHGIDLVLQGFQHAVPVLEFDFPLQQQELRDLLQSWTRRGLRGFCGRSTRLMLFGQESPAPRGAAMTSLGCSAAPSKADGAAQPAIDKK